MTGGQADLAGAAGRATAANVRSAAAVLAGLAHRTPTLTSRALSHAAGCELFFKAEHLQRVGAFKFRGAYHALSRLTGEQRARGVLTYSSGNHAQALALASALMGVRATIVMPSDAPAIKRKGVDGYLLCAPEGSGVVEYDRATQVREDIGRALAERDGLTVVPPYDHPDVIAGQGTAGLELFEEVGELDWLFVPVGGGGLLSGCALAAADVCPGCKVVGVEPAGADDAKRSFESGEIQTVHEPRTIADGARTPSLGVHTFPIIRERARAIVTVTDGELAGAMRLLWERGKQVVEPTGALGLAGVLRAAEAGLDVRGKRVGVMLTGGNVDLDALPGIWALAADA